MGKREKNRKKKRVPVIESDHDLYRAFIGKEKQGDEKTFPEPDQKRTDLNKHGLPVIRELPEEFSRFVPEEAEEDFQTLLDESLKTPVKKEKKSSRPIPLKKRLKRYPGPEKELDLHGYTALGAQVRARSFILSCKHRGFFTLRIIVGKGLHSDLGPVLPDVVEDLLKEMKKEDIVLSFQWDGKKKSRSGAVIIYLKQFRD
ncbi:Smr/MutS family protein [Desulfospira joergensenii]|uniref:Smr/MutS family protein n=1 Tax=Desulfospira joergensenii TaxID=53329 RepID=UPI0003B76D0E|nr:Smr/MutS family protein [Desulfospira joergensenii]